jgi:UPF0755 protein
MSRRPVRVGTIVLAGVVLSVGSGAAGLWAALRPPAPGDAEARTVLVEPGESAWAIARRLEAAGLVRRAWAVVVAARLLGIAHRLQQGEYRFAPSQPALAMLRALARGDRVAHRVTIPEGATVRQIADLLAAAGLADRERFLRVALREGRRFARPSLADLPVDSLEGYLFPETYLLHRGMDEAALIERFLDEFEARVGPAVREAARARGVSLHQLLTIASMIEREARVPDERPVIAGVIYNRLRRGMRLEIDATVLYALGEHKPVVTFADLEVDSPYNTYRRDGLPPGPIANPGAAAIAAAAAPADVPYLYYVLRPDGHHHFSRTYDEHLRAVRRYRP